MPKSSSSLIIAIKPKAKENFRSDAILLFYVLQKYYHNKGVYIVRRSVSLPCIISEPKTEGQFCRSHRPNCFLLLRASCRGAWWNNVDTKFRKNRPSCSKFVVVIQDYGDSVSLLSFRVRLRTELVCCMAVDILFWYLTVWKQKQRCKSWNCGHLQHDMHWIVCGLDLFRDFASIHHCLIPGRAVVSVILWRHRTK